MTYRFLPHTADIRVAIEAPTFGDVLKVATSVARKLLVGDGPVERRETRRVTVTGDDPAELLLHYLQELFYQFETDGFVPADVVIERATGIQACGTIRGEHFDPTRHEPQPEVKAVTRHGLAVTCEDDLWRADLLFDV